MNAVSRGKALMGSYAQMAYTCPHGEPWETIASDIMADLLHAVEEMVAREGGGTGMVDYADLFDTAANNYQEERDTCLMVCDVCGTEWSRYDLCEIGGVCPDESCNGHTYMGDPS